MSSKRLMRRIKITHYEREFFRVAQYCHSPVSLRVSYIFTYETKNAENWITCFLTLKFPDQICNSPFVTHFKFNFGLNIIQNWRWQKNCWNMFLNLKSVIHFLISPYCQPCNSYDVSLQNLVLDQLIIPKLIFFFILITLIWLILYRYWKEKFCLGHS